MLTITDPCAEVNCTDDEWCGEKDGTYGCFCKYPRSDPDTYGQIIYIFLNKIKQDFLLYYLLSMKSHFISYIISFQISQKFARAVLASSLCRVVSFLRMVFLLKSFTSVMLTAKERSRMAEWSFALIKLIRVVQILW